MIKVLIADDQAMVREGFGALLNAQLDIAVVGDASDGEVSGGPKVSVLMARCGRTSKARGE